MTVQTSGRHDGTPLADDVATMLWPDVTRGIGIIYIAVTMAVFVVAGQSSTCQLRRETQIPLRQLLRNFPERGSRLVEFGLKPAAWTLARAHFVPGDTETVVLTT